ncbi:formylglycine-generating enzyme family protein [Motiliproteus sediminis]|uniref:formylglycine-generating enzyme family protein n=1 Tax=Motiliproteus sediminis TaxID=1468178 RepID=UPI001AEF5266|nr:SUMF1/EgtB/PvdO family nonheme iron enzyme [Motiliproteus sediminis]
MPRLRPDLSLLLMAALASHSLAAPLAHWSEPSTGILFTAVPKGCFEMGIDAAVPPKNLSIIGRLGYNLAIGEDAIPRHNVCLESFWIATYEVSVEQWQTLMPLPPGNSSPEQPVRGVSWVMAEEFTKHLNKRHQGPYHFRLPTEAEWEYACLGGSQHPAEGVPLHQVARYEQDGPQTSGMLQPNGYGLHDMLGNVWEWTASPYRPYREVGHISYAPTAPDEPHSLRGGSYRTNYDQMGCQRRSYAPSREELPTFGLRLVRTEKES